MCDYSLQHLASRPARLGDKLITSKFPSTPTGGFAEAGHPNIAVCLLPGTELAFETEIEQSAWFPLLRPRKLGATVARFRRVNENFESAHHDALELPGGRIVLVTRLPANQLATVLQLPRMAPSLNPWKNKGHCNPRKRRAALPHHNGRSYAAPIGRQEPRVKTGG
jgi:hypothetical protein